MVKRVLVLLHQMRWSLRLHPAVVVHEGTRSIRAHAILVDAKPTDATIGCSLDAL